MLDFETILKTAIAGDDLLTLVLSKLRDKSADGPEKLTVRPIELKGSRRYQWSFRTGGQEIHENLPPEDTLTRACELFAEHYAHGHVFTSEADYSLRRNRKGQIHITTAGPSKQRHTSGESHNREKQYLLPENQHCAFLAEIGVMTAQGQVKASRYKKFRQINRYLELVNDVVPHLPEGPLKIVDFGCGKSYLTFALHHLLMVIHQRDVHIVGLDRKAEVVRNCQDIANRLGCRGLEFREGDLWHHQEQRIHLAVSLHACDTATDEALAKAVAWKADVILAVPCCQHEIAAKFPAGFLPAVQGHGILKDRLAALVTDSLRAQALEALGYKTQVVEFIDMEHTAKNVLIRALRRSGDVPGSQQAARDYETFKASLGLETFHLETALAKLQLQIGEQSQCQNSHLTGSTGLTG
jgi:hypothetical protein